MAVKMTQEECAALAAEVKEWRGDVDVKQAASVLGIPHRTLEGVEVGRGFNSPKLLRLAMKFVRAKNGK